MRILYSGQEIWSEHFGGKLDDVFTVQQKISNLVVGSIETEIEHAEQKRAMLTSPASLDAWSAYHRAWWHLNSYTEDCCDLAEHFFKRSLQLDPNFARTYAGISSVHWIRAFQEVTEDRDGAILQALDNAHIGVNLDPRDPLAHWALGRAYHLHCDFKHSNEEFEMANKLNPNFALGQFAQGFAMMLSGDNEDSNTALDKARRLSPYDPMSYAIYGVKAINNAMLGRYDRAAELSDRGAEMLAWRCQMFPVIAALCNAIAGRNEIAQDYFAQLRKQRPDYTVADYLRAFPHQRNSHVDKVEAVFDVLQRSH